MAKKKNSLCYEWMTVLSDEWREREDFLEITRREKKENQLQLFMSFTDDEKKLVEFLKAERVSSIDSLSIHVSLPVSKVSAILLNLEFSGVLRSLPGKMYELIWKYYSKKNGPIRSRFLWLKNILIKKGAC